MENKLITINKTKEELLALPTPAKVDFVGAFQQISKEYVEDIKKSILNGNKADIEGDYYVCHVSKPNDGKVKPLPNWDKIIKYGKQHNFEIPYTVDFEKLQSMDWVLALASNEEYFTLSKGKPYAGKVTITKKGK